MAGINLDIRANTTRALNEFKAFSRQLDNKFLISGLKLDSVKSALTQINREFERALGDQNLVGKDSIRAIQNQNAMILSAYNGLGKDIANTLTQDISLALNNAAKLAGSTIDDVRKTMSAASFVKATTPQERETIAKELLKLQTNYRFAGVTDDFSTLAKDFLSAKITAGDMLQSQDPLQVKLGLAISRATNGSRGPIFNAETRTKALMEALSGFNEEAEALAVRTAGFRITLGKLSATLFNQETGVLGGFRKVLIEGDKYKTTSFDETTKLMDSIFGVENGLIMTFFRQIGKAFGADADSPLKLVIKAVRFITTQVNSLNQFMMSGTFESALKIAKRIFDGIYGFFSDLYKVVQRIIGGDKQGAVADIKKIGEEIRAFIKKVGEAIRNSNTKNESSFAATIASTVASEVAETFGVLIIEVAKALVAKAPEIAGASLAVVNKGVRGLFEGIFGSDSPMLPLLLGAGSFVPGVVGTVSRAGLGTTTVNPQGGPINPWLLAGVGAFTFLPQILRGARNFGRTIGIGGRNRRNNRNRNAGRSFLERLFNPNMGRGGFQQQVIELLEQIADCICGPGGRGRGRGRGAGRGTMHTRTNSQARQIRRDWRRRQAMRNGLGGQPMRAATRPVGVSPWLGGFGRNLGYNRPGTILRNAPARWARQGVNPNSPRQNAVIRGGRARQRTGAFVRPQGAPLLRMNPKAILTGLAITAATAAVVALASGKANATELPGAKMTEAVRKQTQAAEKLTSGMTGVGEVLGGVANGAFTGSLLGSFIPGVGTAIGGVIGGAIGGILPLLDEQTRESVGEFGSGLSDLFSSLGSELKNRTRSGWEKLTTDLSQLPNALSSISNLIQAITSESSSWEPFVKGALKSPLAPAGLGQVLDTFGLLDPVLKRFKDIIASIRLPSWLGGGAEQASTFSALPPVQEVAMSAPRGVTINAPINLEATFTGNAEQNIAQLKERLRPAVLEIVSDAWSMATTGVVTRGAYA